VRLAWSLKRTVSRGSWPPSVARGAQWHELRLERSNRPGPGVHQGIAHRSSPRGEPRGLLFGVLALIMALDYILHQQRRHFSQGLFFANQLALDFAGVPGRCERRLSSAPAQHANVRSAEKLLTRSITYIGLFRRRSLEVRSSKNVAGSCANCSRASCRTLVHAGLRLIDALRQLGRFCLNPYPCSLQLIEASRLASN
jgi:hypothetical protein